MTTETIKAEQTVKASPQRVWDCISTPEGLAGWWAKGNIKPEVGHEFTVDMQNQWGQVPCKILEAREGEKLAYTFDDFELHFTIASEGDGCKVHLEHRGFDDANIKHMFIREKMDSGWRNVLLPKLADTAAAA